MSNVRDTHWAERDRKSMSKLSDALPDVLDTMFTLWQERVDAPKGTPQADPNTFHPTARLYVVRALKMATTREIRDGVEMSVSAPVAPETWRTVLVVADSHNAAWDRVKAELGDGWSLYSDDGWIVWDARKR